MLSPGPVLLHCSGISDGTSTAWKQLSAHRDEEQVEKDVNRAFVYYPSSQY
jgi:TBC1 domain family member 20